MKKFIIKWLGLDVEITRLKCEIEIATHSRNRMSNRITELTNVIDEHLKLTNQSHKQLNQIIEVSNKLKDQVDQIRSLIHVGVDVCHPSYSESWCVVCLKGAGDKQQDIVNFFKIRFEDYKYLKEIFKQMGITSKDAIDCPIGLRKDFFI